MGISSPEIADHNICFIFMFFIFMREYHLTPCLLCWQICEEEGGGNARHGNGHYSPQGRIQNQRARCAIKECGGVGKGHDEGNVKAHADRPRRAEAFVLVGQQADSLFEASPDGIARLPTPPDQFS